MDINNIQLYEKDLEAAQVLCASIKDANRRNRAVASNLASIIAMHSFEDEQYDVDAETGLHNIAGILDEFDISDIYINGNYVDVRVYFSEDELCIPKSHFDTQILPVAYMFIKLSPDLSSGRVMGFITPENVIKSKLKDGYYYLEEDSLNSYYDIESRISGNNEAFIDSNYSIYSYLDGSLSEDEKLSFFRDLVKSKNARISLIKTIRANVICNLISVNNYKEMDETPVEEEFKPAKASVVSGNINDILENGSIVQPEEKQEYETISNEDDLLSALEYSTDVTPSNKEVIEELDDTEVANNVVNSENDKQIDSLFTGEQEGVPVPKKKQSGGFIALVVTLLILCTCGYLIYMHFNSGSSDSNLSDVPFTAENEQTVSAEQPVKQSEDAMPIESVDTVKSSPATNEGVAVSIPQIEKSLDSSVMISNLKVDWEVPSGYVSNTAAKRYLVKMGKVIQLNLKSELLLLSKPPIANKITVELTFNNDIGKFEVAGIKDSSGEKTVDDVILSTIKHVLSMNISSNTESFAKLQGNPVLVIRL